MPSAEPWRREEMSRRMISGTAMFPMVMATPTITVPSMTSAPPPAERTTTPARTPRRVSVMATSAPSRRAASEASGAAREKHSTGIPVSSPSSTGENPRSSAIGPTTGATATNGPRMLRAMSPMQARRIQLPGILESSRSLMGRRGWLAGTRQAVSSVHCYHAGHHSSDKSPFTGTSPVARCRRPAPPGTASAGPPSRLRWR